MSEVRPPRNAEHRAVRRPRRAPQKAKVQAEAASDMPRRAPSKMHNFIVQGSILAMAGIVCRLIGMFYRVPLIEIIGTKGNGYYTSGYSIYNILLILSSYSLPTAISKVVSVRLARRRYEDVQRVLRVAFVYATAAGALMFSIMYFGAPYIADMMEKPFARYVIATLAPTIWIMAYLGVLRGYFQGSGNMMPTAVSQILEQLVNAGVAIFMAYILFGYGAKANLIYGETEYSFAYGAAGATMGTRFGSLIALLFFVLLFLLYGKRPGSASYEAREARRMGGPALLQSRARESYGHIMKVLLATLLPILISSCVYNISTVLDDFLFSRSMTAIGMGSSIVFLWGVFGEYRILFNVPVAMSNSMSSSVIPSLTTAVANRDGRLVAKKIKLSIRFTMLISLPACAGLIALAEPICNLLFHSEDNAVLIRVVMLGAFAVIFFSQSTITNGILQGLGYLSAPLKHAAVALVIHVAALLFLIYVPRLGIYAVILANILFAAIVCWLNSRTIHRHVRFKQDFRKTYTIPSIASAIMGVLVFGLYFAVKLFMPSFVSGRLGLAVVVTVCILLALAVYFFALLLMRAFTKDELAEMPMGMRVYRLARKTGLMR